MAAIAHVTVGGRPLCELSDERLESLGLPTNACEYATLREAEMVGGHDYRAVLGPCPAARRSCR